MKIKWADFQQSTRRRSCNRAIDSQARLLDTAVPLVRFGVTVSSFTANVGQAAPTDDLVGQMA